MLDIKAVDSGVKPAYLFDIGLPVSHKLHGFVADLLHDLLISNHLNVVEMGMDCFIVNVDSINSITLRMAKTLSSFGHSECNSVKTVMEPPREDGLEVKLVDITNDSMPNIVLRETTFRELHDAVAEICSNLKSDSVQIYKLNDSTVCNRTSLYGVLLGYPVVYWFDERENVAKNYLSMVPLSCVQVTAAVPLRMDNTADKTIESHQLYSFSYPACINDELKGVVDEWYEILKRKCKFTIYEEVSVIMTEQSFEAVSL